MFCPFILIRMLYYRYNAHDKIIKRHQDMQDKQRNPWPLLMICIPSAFTAEKPYKRDHRQYNRRNKQLKSLHMSTLSHVSSLLIPAYLEIRYLHSRDRYYISLYDPCPHICLQMRDTGIPKRVLPLHSHPLPDIWHRL